METKERGEPAAENYQPNLWDYEALQLLETNHCDEFTHKIAILVEEMHNILGSEDTDLLSMLELIDKIQRFGLGYHFEGDIRKALEIRVMSLQELGKKGHHDLHDVALSFRLLRQHGYNVSQDVFKSFMDHEGKFKAGVEEDVKGMLSLYEASHLGLEGEDLLVEAITFTRLNLMNKMSKAKTWKMSKGLVARVSHALETPLHHRTQREEARWSIEQAYKHINDHEEEEESTKYPVLLELAKLDFNMLQSNHQKDLKYSLKWWKEMGLISKLSFARDRLVEGFFWCMGIAFEPQHSECRKELTKVAALATTIDDIYDIYGTLDELEIFTDVVMRWDVNDGPKLPDYMKLCFTALYNTTNELVNDNLKEHEHSIKPYLAKVWGDLCKSFLQEARWRHNKEIPRNEEYMENSWVSSSGPLCLVHAYFLMGQGITKEPLQCLYEYYELLRLPSLLFRLYNDLSTSKAELERGENVNSIVCYMNEFGVSSHEVAREKIKELMEKTWREMNKMSQSNGVDDCPFSRKFRETTMNLARIAHFTYHRGDSYGAPDSASKSRVKSLIMDPII